jgi:hypothetical protein
VTTKPATTVTATKTTTRSAQAIRAASARWSRVPAQQIARNALATHFRLPGTRDPEVRLRRLAGVSAWAALLGFGGLLLALRIMVGLFTDIADWYLLLTFFLGVIGIGCTVGAFGSVHKRTLPWILLTGATVAEAICFAATFSR